MVTEEDTTFISIGYPQYHEESQNCEWLLKARDGQNVLLEFQDLDFGDHCYKDGIWIYDGNRNIYYETILTLFIPFIPLNCLYLF